jgi:hypothetical protein
VRDGFRKFNRFFDYRHYFAARKNERRWRGGGTVSDYAAGAAHPTYETVRSHKRG